ncbi:hypothetical protein M8818_002824 [Zalaria obscura]|uniref:Uncharacterized protein n=1 Tax=Zalaria obscura TaxID=2024903 RepID=A0ACC3SLF1_9PEZI
MYSYLLNSWPGPMSYNGLSRVRLPGSFSCLVPGNEERSVLLALDIGHEACSATSRDDVLPAAGLIAWTSKRVRQLIGNRAQAMQRGSGTASSPLPASGKEMPRNLAKQS